MERLEVYLSSSARNSPARIAVEDPERDESIAYLALDTLSDQVRDALLTAGVEEGDRVGIYAPKSIGVVSAIFGTLKAGGGYVPVDYTAPVARNAYIFNDCRVKAIVVEKSLLPGLLKAMDQPGLEIRPLPDEIQGFGVEFVLLRVHPGAFEAPSVRNLAYILYTSGSTGRPKGVTHTHASAMSFIDWCSETFLPRSEDRFSSHAPFHFDLSILDLYVPVKHAATLILIGEELGKQPLRLAEVVAERRISMWYSTPSILRLLVEYGRLEQHDCRHLRIVNYAGEVFPPKHLVALKALWPHPTYFNLYGPTETNVCTFDEIPEQIPADWAAPLSIGRTCSNDRTMIVGEDGQEVQDGEEGELYVTGGSVMHGYWNLSDRTKDAFHLDALGTSWYRTGDLVRKDAEGDYLFIGRKDRMVKRRGYRVELGEVEAALYRHPGVREACAVALPDEENGVIIKAFLSWAEGEHASQIKLKQFAAAHLPLYMVPDRFVSLPALPKTSTDKIDYQSLRNLP